MIRRWLYRFGYWRGQRAGRKFVRLIEKETGRPYEEYLKGGSK